ncbi:SURF1 family protein [Nitrosovibrio tenuis]|uniref:SURF1-like protein n=1 Tax=Nitrosovibrio tenuis TaxID=1233 RepID=A0A1H7RI99_9PROT|nr:SURF1 family protein [Nitrosovibrio tenuis]SEL59087.1 surfeit locus 1 family protein [Nitrosovibrio tenuis]
MTISGWRFTPRLWSTVVAVVVIAIMVQLGNWQLSRAREKESRQEKLDTLSQQSPVSLPADPVKLEDFQYRKIEVHGLYLPEHTVYLDNKIYKGMVGYHIITPLRIGTSSMHVLVNRGWVAADRDRSKLPGVITPDGPVVVSGIAANAVQKTLELSKEMVSGQVWENLDLERYRSTTGLQLQPLMILQQNDVKDGLVREWARPDLGIGKNLGYALQWFAMALAVLIIYLVLSVKREHTQ